MEGSRGGIKYVRSDCHMPHGSLGDKKFLGRTSAQESNMKSLKGLKGTQWKCHVKAVFAELISILLQTAAKKEVLSRKLASAS